MRGVLVGCDRSQEWLLSWWWDNYRQKNTLPVAFADFGMSGAGRTWCEERGCLLPILIDGYKVAVKEEIDPFLLKEWEHSISPFWDSREVWFKKPFALLHAPFLQTLWMDLDCEVLDNVESAYEYIDPICKMGLARVRDPENEEAVPYNSGVIVFEKDSPILEKWAETSFSQNHKFLGDQDVLSHIIFKEGYTVGEVPQIYNWLMFRGVHVGAKILHWAAVWGKEYIKKHGGLRNALNSMRVK